jgi:AcrR family transcriptional regulator
MCTNPILGLVNAARAPVDGRHVRAERTREASVDALLALLEEGDVRPSAERIAARAGVSRRAIFNHFRDVEDLFATVAQKQLARVLPELRPPPTEGTTAERIDACVEATVRLHQKIAPVRRAALLVEPFSPSVAERLEMARRFHRGSIETTFAPEIAREPEATRTTLAAALAMATSYAAWDELCAHQKLSVEQATDALRRTLQGLLAHHGSKPRKENA